MAYSVFRFPILCFSLFIFFHFFFQSPSGVESEIELEVRLMGVHLGEATGTLIFSSFLCLMGVSLCCFQ